MSIARWLVRRTAFAILAVYAVVSVMFGVVAFFPVPGSPPPPPGAPRDAATPLVVRYANWLVEFTTLSWGQYRGIPVMEVIGDALLLTAVYALPAIAVAIPVGTLIGVHSALSDGGAIERLERHGSYLWFAIPTFFLGILLLDLLVWRLHWHDPFYSPERGPFSTYNLLRLSLPAVAVTLGVLAVQVRHARAEVREHRSDEQVKLLRAQGASRWLVGRRLLRLSAAPLVSGVVAELLAVLIPSIIAVEVVFGLPGFGRLLLVTALERSKPLVFGVTVVTVVVAIGGNFLADLVAVVVDPRVGPEGT